MSLRQHSIDACESIDASVFSGDLLFDAEAVLQLEEYIGRWQRAIEAHRKAEAEKLSKGVNILVATPGRLLDHLMVSLKRDLF